MRLWFAFAAVLTVAVPLPAIAYTQEDIEACTPDAMRLCQQAFPDKRSVVLCLVKNRRQLNAACTLAYNRVRAEIVSNGHPAAVQQTKF
jgi:hypothetical protein